MINSSYYSQEVHGPYELHDIGNLELEEGGTIRIANCLRHFRTINGRNAILIPQVNQQDHERLYREGRALGKVLIIVVNRAAVFLLHRTKRAEGGTTCGSVMTARAVQTGG
jgi:homoserine O-acetyltransferase